MECTITDKIKGLKALVEQVQKLGTREKYATEVAAAINAQIKMYEGLQRKEELGKTASAVGVSLYEDTDNEYGSQISWLKKVSGNFEKYLNKSDQKAKNDVWMMRGPYGFFGNPFDKSTVGSVGDGVLTAMYYDWVVNGKVPERYNGDLQELEIARNRLIDHIKDLSPVLQGKVKAYYKGTAKNKTTSHAHAALLIAYQVSKGKLTLKKTHKEETAGTYVKKDTKFGESLDEKQSVSRFQGYVGGFDNNGKGTPEGDGKDKAMRKVADGFIGEVYGTFKNLGSGFKGGYGKETFNKGSSTYVSFDTFDNENITWDAGESESVVTAGNTSPKNKVIMLARNKETRVFSLNPETKKLIKEAHENGTTFVVGDMPGVDSQFIEYLDEIGASYKIYHTGATPRIKKEETVNVYAGTNENAELSNLAVRPFEYDGVKFQSVEHAYQSLKSGEGLNEGVYKRDWSRGGLVVRGKGTKTAGNWNVDVLMKSLMKASFEQNTKAREALFATGNKVLTHVQGDAIWSKEFPRLLMEIREELKEPKEKVEEIKEESSPAVEGKDPLTEEQRSAATKMHKMLKSKDKNVFVLYGEGGTGKRHTVAQVLTELDAKDMDTVIVSALAHAAKDELGNKFEEALSNVGKSMEIRRKVAVELDAIIAGYREGKGSATIVLDEMSMVSSKQLRKIVREVESTEGRLKLIVLGDPAQLRPINTTIRSYPLALNADGTGSIKIGNTKIEGSVDKKVYTDKNNLKYRLFVDKDGYEYRVNEDGTAVDDRPQNVRNVFFKDAEKYKKEQKHTLTRQMRQQSPELAAKIKEFRVEGYLSYAEEQDSKYNEQLEKATRALKADKNVHVATGVSHGMSTFLKEHAYASKLEKGDACVICKSSNVMNATNAIITKAIGTAKGQADIVAKHGVFVGQKLRAYANMDVDTEFGEKKITNNTIADVSKVEEAAGQQVRVRLYDGHPALIAKGVDATQGATAILNLSKLTKEAKKLITVVGLGVKAVDFDYVVLKTGIKAKDLLPGITVEYKDVTGIERAFQLKDIANKVKEKDVVDLFDNFKPVYALNTHKAQGSTFEDIVVVSALTKGKLWQDNAVQELEMRYVAFTRSKNKIAIYDTDSMDVVNEIAEVIKEELTPVDKGPVKLSSDIIDAMNKC